MKRILAALRARLIGLISPSRLMRGKSALDGLSHGELLRALTGAERPCASGVAGAEPGDVSELMARQHDDERGRADLRANLSAGLESSWYERAGESDAILDEHHFTASISTGGPLAHVSICLLTMRNGHHVIGVDYGPPVGAPFVVSTARRLAFNDAVRQIPKRLEMIQREENHRASEVQS
jgi:hypothetical protein